MASPSADPGHARTIAQSHDRCGALGLSRIRVADHTPLIRADLSVARERNRRLSMHAVPVMEMLQEQILATKSMVLLTDVQGTVLHAIGHDDFLARASKVALAPGVNWSEQSKGTNAIGTALVTESPTLVHADEHYMHANHFLTCSASPVFDPRGDVVGVLDVTGDHHSFHNHTMGLVKMSARMIQNHWLVEDTRQSLRVHFHARREYLGTLMECLVAADADGRLHGANGAALDHLGLSGAMLRRHTVASLFGIAAGRLIDHGDAAVALHLPDGRLVHARAEFHGPRSVRPAVAAEPRTVRPLDAPPPAAPKPATGTAATLRDVEREALQRALDESAGNVSAAARRLGVSRGTVYRKLGVAGRRA